MSTIMDKVVVDPMKNAYDDLVNATTAVLEAKQKCKNGEKTAKVDAALHKFRERWDFFQKVCDGAQDFIERAKSIIGCNPFLIDESNSSVAGRLEHVATAASLSSSQATNVVEEDDGEQAAKDK